MQTFTAPATHTVAPLKLLKRFFHVYLIPDSIPCCPTEPHATAHSNLRGLRHRGGDREILAASLVAQTPRPSRTPPRDSMTSASASATQSADDYARFAIGFDPRDRAHFHALIDEVLDSGRWSEGEMVGRFEAAWEAWNGVPAVAASSWAGGALAALDFAGVQGETVLCPSNTFMATPLAAVRAGARVEFVDCNREDLCMSFADFEAKASLLAPRAAFLVHIGGHIAFEVEQIAAYCREHGI